MSLGLFSHPLLVVVGAGGSGKTTLAAGLGLESARAGDRTLVMTFDPSLRLKDALGVGEEARVRPVRVNAGTRAPLDVALLDARSTFDRLIRRYAPDPEAAERVFSNRFYRDLAGNLAGILEYMAVERLFEVQAEGKYDRIVLDTPPTRQALDFLEAPDRIMNFLESGAVRMALKPWWEGRRGLVGVPLRLAAKGAEELADRIIGRQLLRDMLEFFQAFGPLYQGFGERAAEVRTLLRAPETLFILVTAPGEDRIPDAMYFARKLEEAGHHLGPVLVNQMHPVVPDIAAGPEALAGGLALFRFLGQRDRTGFERLGRLLTRHPLIPIPLRPTPPTALPELAALGRQLARATG